jgi:hypothetical protein
MIRRTIDRNERLPDFRCDIAQLQSLFNRIIEHFGETAELSMSISVPLKTEKLDFDNFDEMKLYDGLPPKITKYSISLRERNGNKSCSLRTGLLIEKVQINVSADNEAWCAGITELCRDFAQRHRMWYAFIKRSYLFILFFIMSVIPAISKYLFRDDILFSTFYSGLRWFFVWISIGMLAYFDDSIFPASIVIIRKERSLWREYVPELSLIVAILALVITIVGVIIQATK